MRKGPEDTERGRVGIFACGDGFAKGFQNGLCVFNQGVGLRLVINPAAFSENRDETARLKKSQIRARLVERKPRVSRNRPDRLIRLPDDFSETRKPSQIHQRAAGAPQSRMIIGVFTCHDK